MERFILVLKVMVLILVFHGDGGAAYDFVQLIQQWPPAYCGIHPHICDTTAAMATTRLTIHGFWPDYNDGTILEYCDNTSVLVPAQIVNQRTNLDTQWPTFQLNWTNFNLWSHEWKMHGTCFGYNPTPSQYFQTALDLKMNPRYDLYQILSHNRPNLAPTIDPARKVTPFQLQTALHNVLTYLPAFHCEKVPNKPQWLITEIVLCFERKGVGFGLRDCPDFVTKNCDSSRKYSWVASNTTTYSSSSLLLGVLIVGGVGSFFGFVRRPRRISEFYHCLTAARSAPVKED